MVLRPLTRRAFLTAGAAALAWRPRLARAIAVEETTPGVSPLGLGSGNRDGLLYVPARYSPATPLPLVVMLHGAGGSAQSVDYTFPLADELGLFVLAPDSRGWTWDSLLDGIGPDLAFIGTAFRQTLGRVNVDRRRMALAGHSDGASYVLSAGIGLGDVFTHLMAFSPGVMTPIAATGKPRVFISHGRDDAVMPIDDTSRRFVPRLTALGYDVTYREYDGRHAVPVSVVREAFTWLVAT